MLRVFLAVSAAILLAPLVLAGGLIQPGAAQMLPGEAEAGPGKPGEAGARAAKAAGKSAKGAGRAARLAREEAQRDGNINIIIERRKKATKFEDLSPDADQRSREQDGPEEGKASDLGSSGNSGDTAARKAELKRRGRAATLLSGTEGIRDKLGRSGRRAPGKSLG